MDSISIRVAEDVTLPIDTGDLTAVSATIYIGKPGNNYTLTQTISLEDGEGVFHFTEEDTNISADTYYYQINVTDAEGEISKYPSPVAGCEDCTEFPVFLVCTSLDQYVA